MEDARMPIAWASALRPVASLIGAGRDSWIEVGEEEVVAHMGPLARVRFPRRLVLEVRRIDWPWLLGLGIRIYGRRAVGLVGSRHRHAGGHAVGSSVVEFRLAHPVRIRAAVPMWVDRLAVSVEEPEKLISLFEPYHGHPTVRRRRSAA